MKLINMLGQRIGRLVVIKRLSNRTTPGGQIKTRWLCRCNCGREIKLYAGDLRRGNKESCGCAQTERLIARSITHGMTKSLEYSTWLAMKNRCSNPKSDRWRWYGARGIKICNEWKNDFSRFYADMGPRPKGMTLDRINNNGNYEPGNCRWATPTQQSRNRRNKTTKLKGKQ